MLVIFSGIIKLVDRILAAKKADPGAQFTGDGYIEVLKASGTRIGMDGRGRALDNVFIERLWWSVKYEDIYLNDYCNGTSLHEGLTRHFRFYNTERFHQALGYVTPARVYLGKAVA